MSDHVDMVLVSHSVLSVSQLNQDHDGHVDMVLVSRSVLSVSQLAQDHIQSCGNGPGLSFSPLGVTTGPGPCLVMWTWSWSLIQSSRCHNLPRTMSGHVDMVLVSHAVLSVSQLAQDNDGHVAMVLVSHSVLSVSQLAQDHDGHVDMVLVSHSVLSVSQGSHPVMWTWSWSLIQSSRCHNWPRTMFT